MSFLLNPATWEAAFKIGGLIAGALVSTGVIKNAWVNRKLLLTALAKEAWGATETWKKTKATVSTPDESEAYFFVEMGKLLYSKKAKSINMTDTLFLSAWVKARSAAAHAAGK